MARIHRCNDCGNDLPGNWRPIATRTVEAICPECALRYMKTRSVRRAVLEQYREHKNPDNLPQTNAS